jgi:hypothetical protein
VCPTDLDKENRRGNHIFKKALSGNITSTVVIKLDACIFLNVEIHLNEAYMRDNAEQL